MRNISSEIKYKSAMWRTIEFVVLAVQLLNKTGACYYPGSVMRSINFPLLLKIARVLSVPVVAKYPPLPRCQHTFTYPSP